MTTLVLTSLLGVLADAGQYAPGRTRIQGGWEFVWVSYGITWAALALYAVFLFLRRVPSDAQGTPPSVPGKEAKS